MPRRKITSADRKLKQGRGRGHGEKYKPFLTVREVPSRGLSHRIKGWTTSRVHHFLSNLEKNYFYLLDWSSLVVDIREQFPLPIEDTMMISERLGVRHPTDPKTKESTIMTTDFLVDLLSEGKSVMVARSVKMSQDLGSKRVLEKLEIERTYWAERKVDWGIVTELDIPKAVAEYVEWIHSSADIASSPGLTPQIISQAEAALYDLITENPRESLAHAALAIDHALGLNAGSGLWVVRHLIASGRWTVDMTKAIATDKPLHVARVAGHPTEQEHSA